jgi:hypothetical protein
MDSTEHALVVAGTLILSGGYLAWIHWRGYITDGLGDEFWREDDPTGYWIRFATMAALSATLLILELVCPFSSVT